MGYQRGGANEDACGVMVLLLTKQIAEDGETSSPIAKKHLIGSQQARKAFEI